MNKKLFNYEKLIRDLEDIRAERDRRAISATYEKLSDREKNKLAELLTKNKK